MELATRGSELVTREFELALLNGEKEMEHFSQMTSMKFMRKKSSGEGLILCYHLEMQEKNTSRKSLDS